MSDFPSYQPPPTEPRFIKARMLVAYFWPLAIVFLVGLGAFAVVAFPDLFNRSGPPIDESAFARPNAAATASTTPEEPESSLVALGNTSLWVDSDPVGAGVLIDEDSVGVTPMLVPVVEFGRRKVTVRAQGYERSDTVMLIDDDAPAELWVTLQPAQ